MTRRAQGPQPAGFVGINWANPLTRGLVAAYTNGVDHVTGQPRPQVDTTQGQTLPVNANGRRALVASTGSNNSVVLGAAIGDTGPLTYICKGIKTSQDGGQGILMGYGDRATLLLGAAGSGLSYRFYFYHDVPSSGWEDCNIVGDPTVLGPFCIAGRYNATTQIGSVHGYGPGRDYETYASPTPYPRISVGTRTVTIGRDDGDTNRSTGANIEVALVYNIALTDGQIRSLIDDPWQVFRSLRRTALPSEAQLQLFGTLGQFDAELRAACWF